jgi:PadR family transcriptional regulator, regulatory protein PadR
MATSSQSSQSDLLQGTLDLLILKTLAQEAAGSGGAAASGSGGAAGANGASGTGSVKGMHGWGIGARIQQVSKDALQVGQGSLYPALHRLEYKGWIRAEWGASENNRKAKFYALTARGRKQLVEELEDWDRLTAAIALVLKQA